MSNNTHMAGQRGRAPSTAADVNQLIRSCQKKFSEFGHLDFKAEALFATQLCAQNEGLRNTALRNQTSLRMAMVNVAAVGLTLNPAQGLAFLVPRDGRVILDISYRGLIALGVETGAIEWAKAELVYEEDTFVYKGPSVIPDHHCDPFSTERGNVRGGYCIAKLVSGGHMIEVMSYADMEKIRNSSPLGKKDEGPWILWEDQMQLKSIVKRGSKWWPKPSSRFSEAIRILNEENGEGLSELKTVTPVEAVTAALPEPAPEAEVSETTRGLIANLLNRASANGAFEPCREIVTSRISDPAELAFAMSRLDTAEGEYKATISEMQQSFL